MSMTRLMKNSMLGVFRAMAKLQLSTARLLRPCAMSVQDA